MSKILGSAVLIVLGVLLGFAIALMLVSGWQWYSLTASVPTQTNPGTQAATTAPAPPGVKPQASISAAESEEVLAKKLESYSKQADGIERLMSWLLLLSGAYAALLAWDARSRAKDAADTFEKLQKDTEDKAGKLLSETKVTVEKAVPLFKDIESKLDRVVTELRHLLPTVDLSNEKYRSPSGPERERILYYEKTIAATEYLNTDLWSDIMSEICQGLGNFYADAANTARDLDNVATARFYLKRATEKNPKNSAAWNDLGYLEMRIYAEILLAGDVTQIDTRRKELEAIDARIKSGTAASPEDKEKLKSARDFFVELAETLLRVESRDTRAHQQLQRYGLRSIRKKEWEEFQKDSLGLYQDFRAVLVDCQESAFQRAIDAFLQSDKIDEHQQRSKYNLGLMRFRKGDFEASIELFSAALKCTRWQQRESARYGSEISYNLACAEARSSSGLTGPAQKSRLTLALQHLKEALEKEHTAELQKAFCSGDPDLALLAGHAELKQAYKTLLEEHCP